METNGENESKKSTDINISYAGIVSRGKDLSTDVSNNNPSISSDITNGNEQSSDLSSDSQNSAITPANNAYILETESSPTNSFQTEGNKPDLNSSVSEDTASGVKSDIVDSEETTVSSATANNSEQSSNLVRNESSSAECSDSGEESDDASNEVENHYPNALTWKLRSRSILKNLPETVTLLETSYGSKVFLVGTAHFSLESQEDVAKTIRAVQPDSVVLELCKSRVNILSLDEATVLEEAKGLNFQKIKTTLEQNGLLQGVLYFLLLSMSVHLTKQLGMAPGGEFRRAYTEAMQIPGCMVHLGDRPIHITLHRALAKLSLWQKLRIAWQILRAKGPISKEEVERCKQKDLLEEMLAEMTGEFPEISQVFVTERDIYLAYSLQMAALPSPPLRSSGLPTPTCVVGVVGIGHVSGIKENWGKVTDADIPPILHIPEASLSSKIIRQSIRFAVMGLGLYGAYKLLPKSLIPSRPKNLFPFFNMKLF